MKMFFFSLENEISEEIVDEEEPEAPKPKIYNTITQTINPSTSRPNHRVLAYPNFNLEKPVLVGQQLAGKSADATTEDEDAPELQMFTANEAILADIQANIRQNYEDVYDENIFSKVW